MGVVRIQELRGRGELRLFGTSGNNYLSHRAPATVTGSYDITWPAAAPAGDRIMQVSAAGVISFIAAGGGTLDNSYNFGGAGAGRLITADTGAFEVNVPAAGGNVGVVIDQDDDFKALDITKDGVGVGDAIAVLNSGTGRGLFLDQDGAAAALEIDQDGAAVAFIINQASANAAISVTQAGAANALAIAAGGAVAIGVTQGNDFGALLITKTGLGIGDCIAVENDGTGRGLFLDQDGDGPALVIDQDGDNVAFDLNQAANFVALKVVKAGVGAGDAVSIENNGTGKGLFINQDGDALGCHIDQSGDAAALFVGKSSSGSQRCVEFDNNGPGQDLILNQDGNGIALDIDSEATSQPLISLAPVTGNTRGDIAFGTARIADPASPAEGDLWYDGTLERLKIATSSGDRDVASNYGPGMGLRSTRTVATGVLTIISGYVNVAAESGTTDDVVTITSATPVANVGDRIILTADAGDTITVKHGTGNVSLDGSADKVLTEGDVLELLKQTDGPESWSQVAYSNNG